ncbi:hypothetical protein CO046_03740 [Candidatus Peregrinibacteria bacterium CG_4_9_14_0_2_um_filter_53_11]|nr:MAG: hypothetical protein CO046_03740 [Candidatus Peregrinibacteria bacterium CG_4_9_14_0_2_um_filter_53_11]
MAKEDTIKIDTGLEVGRQKAEVASTQPVAPAIDRLTTSQQAAVASALAPQRGFQADEVAQHVGSPADAAKLRESLTTMASFAEIDIENEREVDAAMALYESLFPNEDEREPREVIEGRLRDMAKIDTDPELQEKYGQSRFHALVAHDHKGRVVAYSQFSTMPLPEHGENLSFYQYSGIASEEFMREHYGVEGGLRGGGHYYAIDAAKRLLASQDAKKAGFENGNAGAIFESEFIGQAEADDEEGLRFTQKRLEIHNRMGAKAIMLQMEDGSLVSPHMQPRLSAESNPILLLMLFRPPTYDKSAIGTTEEMDLGRAKAFVQAYFNNFRQEGFEESDIAEAEAIVMAKFARAKRAVLVAPNQLPDITELAKDDPDLMAQVKKDYIDPEAHAAAIKAAFAPETSGGEGSNDRGL